MNLNELPKGTTTELNKDDKINQILWPQRAVSMFLQQAEDDDSPMSHTPALIIPCVNGDNEPQQPIFIFNETYPLGEILSALLQMLWDAEGIRAIEETASFQSTRMELTNSRPVIFDRLSPEEQEQFIFTGDEITGDDFEDGSGE